MDRYEGVSLKGGADEVLVVGVEQTCFSFGTFVAFTLISFPFFHLS